MKDKKHRGRGRPATGNQFVPGYRITPAMRKRFRRLAEDMHGADAAERKLDNEAARLFRMAAAVGEKILLTDFASMVTFLRDQGIEEGEARRRAIQHERDSMMGMLEIMWRNPETGEAGHEILEEGE